MIKHMNTLPSNGKITVPSSTPIAPTSFASKEKEGGFLTNNESPITDLGKEMDLPKEVVSAGVTIRPTVVSIPPPVQNLGVRVTGTNNKTPSTRAAVIPLSDIQMAEGMHTNISNSIRWLAEWCRYKLKKLGLLQ
jgi:hypothetical protein